MEYRSLAIGYRRLIERMTGLRGVPQPLEVFSEVEDMSVRASELFELVAWVRCNKTYLMRNDRPPMGDIAVMASGNLGFKVSVNSLRDVLESEGLPVRRPSQAAATDQEIADLRGRVDLLTGVVRDFLAMQYVSPDAKRALELHLPDGWDAPVPEAVRGESGASEGVSENDGTVVG